METHTVAKECNMTNKKAQGLSINTVILIALGIIVLIIMTYTFYNSSKQYGNQTGDTQTQVTSKICTVTGKCQVDNPNPKPDAENPSVYTDLPEPDGGWLDCSTKCWKRN